MKYLIIVFAAFFTINIIACKKHTATATTPNGIVGKWSLYEVYGNDYWGGPAYWKPADGNTKIEFTADKKYYRKEPTQSNYSLIGTYILIDNNKIQITPANAQYSPYSLTYNFENGGYLTWGYFSTEDLQQEKFKIGE